jgi:hypothetical protein
MTIADIVQEVAKQNNLKIEQLTVDHIVEWIVNKNKLGEFLSSINEDALKLTPLKKPYNGKPSIDRLLTGDTFVGIATALAKIGHSQEAEKVFQLILNRTPHDTTALNDYGVLVINELINEYNKGVKISKERLAVARKQIYDATIIDRHLHEDPRLLPAYKNLCLLRIVEAITYLNEREAFTAFLLAWMPIEMTICRIWYKLSKENYEGKGKIDALERWNIDTVIEVLFINKIDPEFCKLKPELDSLKGFRNDLLHGRMLEITEGQARHSIEVAQKLIPIKQ